MPKSKIVGTVVRILVRQADEVLLVQSHRQEAAGEWELPGGKRKKKEKLFTAAQRELQEETSLQLMRANQIVDWSRETPFQTYWRYVAFQALEWTGTPTIIDFDEIKKIGWCSLASLPPLDEHTKTLATKFKTELGF